MVEKTNFISEVVGRLGHHEKPKASEGYLAIFFVVAVIFAYGFVECGLAHLIRKLGKRALQRMDEEYWKANGGRDKK